MNKQSNLSQQILNTFGVKTSQQRKDEQLQLITKKYEFARSPSRQFVNNLIKLAKTLLEKGADTNYVNKKGETVLSIAVNGGNKELVELLLEKGADIDYVNKKGETALSIAVKGGNKELVKLLLNEGADVNIRKNKTTSIDIKISENITEQYKPIYEKWFSEYRDRENKVESPIHIAVQSSDTNIVPLLLKHGADLSVKDEFDKTPLDIAQKEGNEKVKELLSEHDVNNNVVKSKFNNLEVSKVEVEKDINLI